MRFQSVRRFLGGDVQDYLKSVLSGSLEDLINGLSKLTFRDNFIQTQVDVSLEASEEKAIAHYLGVVPAGRLIFRNSGALLLDATTSPDDKFWYFVNTSGSDAATATVIFFR